MLGLLHADEPSIRRDEPDDSARERPKDDLTVQVRLLFGGPWHRRLIGGEFTACGERVYFRNSVDSSLRMETYRGHLCVAGCFSQHELAISLDASRVEEQQQKAQARIDRETDKFKRWVAASDEYNSLIKKDDEE